MMFAAPAIAQDRVGEISDVEGIARLESSGKTVAVVPLLSIYQRDKVTTAEKSHLVIALIDGSRLTIAESSVVTIDEFLLAGNLRKSATVRLLGGHLRALVHAVGGRNFEVRTPNAALGVR